MDRVRILIVETNDEIRSALSDLLGQAGFDCIETTSGHEAVSLVRRERPGLVLLDVRLPDISGYEVCHELREEFGEALSIVFLSADRTEPMDTAVGLLIGADDYVSKPFDSGELLARVKRLARRGSVELSAAVGRQTSLTRRERQVLTLLALGRRSEEIARELVISEKTVSSHLQRVLAKLGVNSRAQAVAVAYRDGLMATSTVGQESAATT